MTVETAMTIKNDPRLRQVEWRDLIALNRLDIVRELTLSVPWLLGSLVFAHYRIFPSPWRSRSSSSSPASVRSTTPITTRSASSDPRPSG